MKKRLIFPFLILLVFLVALFLLLSQVRKQQEIRQRASETPTETQYVILNKRGDGINPWNFENPAGITDSAVDEIMQKLGTLGTGNKKIGIGIIISYLRSYCAPTGVLTPSDLTRFCNKDVEAIQRVIAISERKNIPVLIKLDGFSWWDERADLWNWWDSNQYGYNPTNKQNVEWTSFDPNSAIKISWRNWGSQIRVKPHPNLGSPLYIAAKQEKLQQLLPLITTWYNNLPNDKKYLLAGVVLDNELSIGHNFYYYNNGNDYLSQDSSNDPFQYLDYSAGTVSTGMAQLGYAALTNYGIKNSGTITVADLNEIVKRHATFLAQTALGSGLPASKLYVHGIGNVLSSNPQLFSYEGVITSLVNPGWSFYQYAQNPNSAPGFTNSLSQNSTGKWGAVEWLYQDSDETGWEQALRNTLTTTGNNLIAIYNWEGIVDNNNALVAIRNVVSPELSGTPLPTPLPSPTPTPAYLCFVCGSNRLWRTIYSSLGDSHSCDNLNPQTIPLCPTTPQPDGNPAFEGCKSLQNIHGTACSVPSTISTTPTQIIGDINGDRIVNVRDFDIWRCEFVGNGACANPPSNRTADLNRDTRVDLQDYTMWRNAIGI